MRSITCCTAFTLSNGQNGMVKKSLRLT
uniref:Uncharacterized protein n=1 Tax=Anguilla anguilla TaxID=7936 RepID=A0A0E9QAQ2_ANGAN